MTPSPTPSPDRVTPILTTLISALVSVAVAWITTGKTFDEKLTENSTQVMTLRDTVGAVTGRISEQLTQATHRLDQVARELASAQVQNQKLQSELASLRGGIKAANAEVETVRVRAEALHQLVPRDVNKLRLVPAQRP